MHERHMPASDASYRPLKAFVALNGGVRLAMHGGLRDRLVELAVENWPVNCEPARLRDVVAAKLRIAIRNRYGSILATFLISVLVQAIARLVVEWWLSRSSHRVLMVGWANAAQGRDI